MTVTRLRILATTSAGNGLRYFRWFMISWHLGLILPFEDVSLYCVCYGATRTAVANILSRLLIYFPPYKPPIRLIKHGCTVTGLSPYYVRGKLLSVETCKLARLHGHSPSHIATDNSSTPRRYFIHLSHQIDSACNRAATPESEGRSLVRIERTI